MHLKIVGTYMTDVLLILVNLYKIITHLFVMQM